VEAAGGIFVGYRKAESAAEFSEILVMCHRQKLDRLCALLPRKYAKPTASDLLTTIQKNGRTLL
jgi:hypothetical protein